MAEAQIIPMPRRPPHPGELRNKIAELARAGRLAFGHHAFKVRRGQRGIELEDARRVLILGEIEGGIEEGARTGEWKCKMVAKAEESSRRIGVAVVVVRNERLFIKTVEWEYR